MEFLVHGCYLRIFQAKIGGPFAHPIGVSPLRVILSSFSRSWNHFVGSSPPLDQRKRLSRGTRHSSRAHDCSGHRMTAPTLLGHVGAVSGPLVSIRQFQGIASGIAIIGGRSYRIGQVGRISSLSRKDTMTFTGSFQMLERPPRQKR